MFNQNLTREPGAPARLYQLLEATPDGGYDDDHGMPVLEDSTGGYVADVEASMGAMTGASVDEITDLVAAALNVSAEKVWPSPVGANISGDASNVNTATTSDRWDVVVADDAPLGWGWWRP